MEKQKIQLENLLDAVKQGIDSQNERKHIDWEKTTGEKYLDILTSVRAAYEFAENAHRGQFRADGKTPYITHPVEVAYRLATEFEKCGERFQSSSMYISSSNYASFVQAGLLHDVVEDCGISLEEIAKEFGNEAALLVDGMTKVVREKDGKIESDKDATLRKIAAYGFKDPRLFLIKLCDVAHNSSGIANLAKEKQDRFAKYGIEFYAPLAESLGFEKLAEEIRGYNSKYYDGDGKSLLFKYFGNSRDLGSANSTFHGMEELS